MPTTTDNVERALARAARRLRGHGSGAADARRLLELATGWSAAMLLARRNDALAPAAAAAFEAALARRERGEPVAYIAGSAGFYGRTFAVTPDVLVPRPESEHVLEAVLAELRSRPADRRVVADVGTGSGCLGISLACELPDLHVVASDASQAALEVARGNARALGAAERVRFFYGDLATPLVAYAPLDVVVANLPYVPSADVPRAPDPVSFEPLVAVDGGPDGLVLYRRLVAQLAALLRPGAALFFEAAPPTIEPLAAILGAAFPGVHVEIGEDYAGLERFVSATLREEAGGAQGRSAAHAES